MRLPERSRQRPAELDHVAEAQSLEQPRHRAVEVLVAEVELDGRPRPVGALAPALADGDEVDGIGEVDAERAVRAARDAVATGKLSQIQT